jgi:hypothetical protein
MRSGQRSSSSLGPRFESRSYFAQAVSFTDRDEGLSTWLGPPSPESVERCKGGSGLRKRQPHFTAQPAMPAQRSALEPIGVLVAEQ